MSLIDSLGGGDFNPSFRFAKPGDVVVGTIAETPRQVTTINDEGKSRDQVIFTLHIARDKCVSHRKNKNNDGTVTLAPVDLGESDLWSVWVPQNSNIAGAVKKAAVSAGARDFGIGDLLQITLTGYGTASKPGFSPPGLYEAAYKVAAPVSDDPFAGL